MLIAIVKRHRLAIESAIYGSIGSFKKYKIRRSTLKKSKQNASEKSDANSNTSNVTTTATEVAFFPRYSVVNKSWKESKKKLAKTADTSDDLKNEVPEKLNEEDKPQNIDDSKKMESVSVNKSSKRSKLDKGTDAMLQTQTKKSVKMNLNTSKQSLYEIISTLKFKTQQQNLQQQQKQQNSQQQIVVNKGAGLQTSFYFHGGNLSSDGSKYDLTLARGLSKKVEAQVHQPSHDVKEKSVIEVEPESGSAPSPQPLISDKNSSSSENIYSFNTLREKCRLLIANSKSFQHKTRL